MNNYEQRLVLQNETAGRIRIPPGSRWYPLPALKPATHPAQPGERQFTQVRLKVYVLTGCCPSHFNPIFALVTRPRAGFVKPRTGKTTS
jgi:hypothetical protein